MGLIFPIYLYKKLKNLLVRSQWTDFNITWQECFFGDPLPGCSSCHDRQKTWPLRGRAYFSLYVYIKNFKNLLVRNRWTKLNVAWQECCFCNPLPVWFKPSWYVKKNMASRGRGLFSVYICIENFKMLLVKYLLTNFNNTLVTLYQECSSNPDLSKNMPASGWGLFSLYI